MNKKKLLVALSLCSLLGAQSVFAADTPAADGTCQDGVTANSAERSGDGSETDAHATALATAVIASDSDGGPEDHTDTVKPARDWLLGDKLRSDSEILMRTAKRLAEDPAAFLRKHDYPETLAFLHETHENEFFTDNLALVGLKITGALALAGDEKTPDNTRKQFKAATRSLLGAYSVIATCANNEQRLYAEALVALESNNRSKDGLSTSLAL